MRRGIGRTLTRASRDDSERATTLKNRRPGIIRPRMRQGDIGPDAGLSWGTREGEYDHNFPSSRRRLDISVATSIHRHNRCRLARSGESESAAVIMVE